MEKLNQEVSEAEIKGLQIGIHSRVINDAEFIYLEFAKRINGLSFYEQMIPDELFCYVTKNTYSLKCTAQKAGNLMQRLLFDDKDQTA